MPMHRAGPIGVVYGGGTSSRRLEMSGGGSPRSLEGGPGVLPREIFLKSMSLRMRFRPF